ncbi:MAG: sugar ABC transporter substrate-binding protein [Eubacteriales bacterium]|nr:sugar ABC transporter substrate-binding protein [Eubacteriales bacterium]
MKSTRKILAVLMCIMVTVMSGVSVYGSDEAAGAEYYGLLKEGVGTESPEAVPAKEEYTIGVLLPMLANAHFTAEAYGFESEGEALGVNTIIWDCGGYAYFDKQLTQMEDLIAMDVDAIILVAADPDACVATIDKAFDAGIPVINVNVMANSDKVMKIRSNDSDIGALEAERLGELMGGKGNVLMVRGTAGTSWAIGRGDGFIAYMEENYPDINILAELWCANEVDAAMQQVEDAIMAYGDEIDAVYAPGENTIKGAVLALKAAGMNDVYAVSCDPADDTIAMLQEGSVNASVVQFSVGLGQWGMRAAVNILNGDASDLYQTYYATLNVVDTENVDDFEFVGISKAPDGWSLAQ